MPESTLNTPKIARLDFKTDLGAGARARIGLLVLESDQTMEWEMRHMADLPGVALYHARLANDAEVTPDTLVQMELERPYKYFWLYVTRSSTKIELFHG